MKRNRIDLFTHAEKLIYNAMQAVEEMPASEHLTDAVILLGEAQDKVADYVIEQEKLINQSTN